MVRLKRLKFRWWKTGLEGFKLWIKEAGVWICRAKALSWT